MDQLYMIGNAHLDPVWFWPWQEGYQEVKATFLSALDRMEETPGFVFTCAGADYYRWVEENEPDLFDKIRRRVAQGRWVIVGGMWIQPDMNTPSGESFARQLLYSQRYFMEKFGRIATVGYNVDSFGHHAMTPQLLKKAGIDYYVWMRPGQQENASIPRGPMVWEGVDGTQVYAYRIEGEYYGDVRLDEKIDRLLAFSDEIGFPAMCFYGIGNHGGGPTIRNLMEIEKYRQSQPRGGQVAYASPVDYFDALGKNGKPLPLWQGELQHHASGCYSTHSLSKRKHRQAENALLRMEKLGVLSRVLTGFRHKDIFVAQAWQNLLFNEFHDAMGGCCAQDVMDTVVMQLDETLSIAAREENAALQRISWQVDTSKGLPKPIRSKEGEIFLWHDEDLGTPVVVFNPHEFEAEGTVHIRRPIRSATDDAGTPVPAQMIRAGRTNLNDLHDGIFRAKVPPLGYRLYWVYLHDGPQAQSTLSVSNHHIENALIRAEFCPETGAMTALISKPTGKNVLAAPAMARLMDISHCDTWAHMVFAFDKEAGVFDHACITVLENGPARAALRVTTHHGQSRLEQTYFLHEGADQLEVQVRLDMQDKHRMMKLCFPTCFADGKDVAEIPYGAITRQANQDEEHCQRYVCMQGTDGGLALLNDGKYSYSAKDGEIRMTAANTSIFADHYGQNLRDDTCQYMDMGEQLFTYALLPYTGSWQHQKLHRRAAQLNQPLPYVAETYHKGPLPGTFTGIAIDDAAISLGALKRAEDGTGYVLRLSESTGKPCRTTLRLPLLGQDMQLCFAPFEIKTLYLPDDAAQHAREIAITELDIHTEG